MKSKKWEKVLRTETLSVFRSTSKPTVYEISWRKSDGRYGRRRFNAPSVDEAVRLGPKIMADSRGAGRPRPQEVLTVAAAFGETLAASRRKESARRDWRWACKRFVRWLADNRPECKYWHLVDRRGVRDYLTSVGGSDNTRRLMLQPLSQTGRFMRREYGMEDVTEGLRTGTQLAKAPAGVFLVDVVDFLGWLREHDPELEAAVGLQGLAGLRVLEVLRLTWDRVDLRGGLVEISGEVKTPDSRRVIPVAGMVIEALGRCRRVARAGNIETIVDHVVRGKGGEGYVDYRSFGRRLRRGMRLWNAAVEWAPKDLRNCLPTWAELEGVRNGVWEQYLGHAARGVTARHYVPRLGAVTAGEGGELRRAMEVFRGQVVGPLEAGIEAAVRALEQKRARAEHGEDTRGDAGSA